MHAFYSARGLATQLGCVLTAGVVGMGSWFSASQSDVEELLERLEGRFRIVWQCYDVEQDCWRDYPPIVNSRIEHCWRTDGRWAFGGEHVPHRFDTDFVRMREVSELAPRTCRRVRRLIVTHD